MLSVLKNYTVKEMKNLRLIMSSKLYFIAYILILIEYSLG